MTFYNNIDIGFSVGGCGFHAVNMSFAEINRDIPLHSHGANCYEIHYISEGRGTLVANGAEYPVEPETLFVTGPLAEHSQISDPDDPMLEWCVYLRADGERGGRGGIIARFLKETFWAGRDGQGLLPLLERLFSELGSRRDGYREMAELLLSEIVISVARNYIETPSGSGEISGCAAERASIIIEEYFLYEYRTATLSELSGRLGLSERQTQRVIGSYYNSTFGEKRTQARMSAAEILLADGSLSLADVAERLGYSSQEYFTSAFKRYYGVSPGKYRKNKSREKLSADNFSIDNGHFFN